MEKELRPGKYRHYKGREYRVIGTALHSETLEHLVVYQAADGSGNIWARPVAMWCEHVEKDGVLLPRFTFIGE